jgi:hypothetical protein
VEVLAPPGPLVSIVTPSLNPGERLERCLDSVASQTHGRIEHIVVDGGSTDGTLELLARRGMPFVSEKDDGQTDALNKGFALAAGVYIGWLNADDVLLPHAVEQVVSAFAGSAEVGWVYGDCAFRRGNDCLVRERSTPVVRRQTLLSGNLITQPGSLIARWALDRIGPLDASFDLAMDYDLWLRLVDAGVRSAYVPTTLAIFEIHEGSKTGTVDPADFPREEALALLKSGRPRHAALAFGRAAATAAADARGVIDGARLRVEIERLTVEASEHGLAGLGGIVASAAYAQAGLIELQRSLRGFRHLARLQPWRYGETRRQVAASAWRKARRGPHPADASVSGITL